MLLHSLVALSVAAAAVTLSADETRARLTVTHRSLVPLCFNSASVDNTRHWSVDSSPVTMAFTMRNQPRTNVPPHQRIENTPSGVAVISFVPEPGHNYEVEVRADATAYSRRVYPKGEWMPVVRDRTTDRIVSGAPEWGKNACGK
jgi:hypothetical protein